MIVEDDVELANLFATWLRETYAVAVATDCAAAREALDETVDVALLDRQLPDGSGDDLLASIRARDLDCRVAMVSAVDPGLDVIEMGFDEYVCKPVGRDELHETVARLVTQGDYGDAVAEHYRLAAKKAVLESHCTRGELEGSAAFAALDARLAELDTELSQIVDSLSETQIAAEFARLSTDGVQG